jgi:hypothetical protein
LRLIIYHQTFNSVGVGAKGGFVLGKNFMDGGLRHFVGLFGRATTKLALKRFP